MLFKHLLPISLAAVVTAQGNLPNITTLLQNTPDLSNLLTLLTDPSRSALLNTLANAQNITIVAPNNQAFTTAPNAPASLITDVLTYHVLKGVIMSDQISTKPIFAHSLLNSTMLANVTGGQNVEAVVAGGKPVFMSGLGASSSVVKAVSQRFSPLSH